MAGSVAVTRHYLSHNGGTLVVKLACIGDVAGGAVPATQITAAEIAPIGYQLNYQMMGYYLYEVWTVAGAPAPDPADITITDELASELYSEVGIITAAGTVEGTLAKYKAVTSLLTMTVANQATNSAVWDVYLKLVR